jgi:hypothetical protein
LNLDGPWRFHAGDDPHFADPGLDDSSWPSIRPNQQFLAVGISSRPSGYLWARIHLRVPTTAGPLALAVYPSDTAQYEVFVDGSPTASTPGMATRTLRYGSSFPVELPPAGDIVLAIRFYYGLNGGYSSFQSQTLPFTRVSFGSLASVRASLELERLRDFNNGPIGNYALLCIYLLVAITAVFLYRAQRGHEEYLWLGIASLCFALYDILGIAIVSGWLPLNVAVILAGDYSGWFATITHIEFVVRFTRTRRLWPIRTVQGAMLIPPLLAANPAIHMLYASAVVIGLFLFLAVVAPCLTAAYRSGMAESGLMLIPTVLAVSLNFAWGAARVFPTTVPWGDEFHFGPIGIAGNCLGGMVFCLGLFAVVLFRFIRVARDEERAAAELEAARTVQQILIPDQSDALPGFSVESVYQPAQQVGGDFFQVLPASDGGLLLVLGDVAGKGLPAAMLVAALVGAVRSLVRFTHSPSRILEELNESLVGRAGHGFSTCLAAYIAPNGQVAIANAGHLPPYLDGREIDLPGALPLGIASGVRYDSLAFDLQPGNRLTFYSDGVIEAQSPAGELFGFDRSRDISVRPAAEIAEAARAFGQQDDITVVAIARAGAPDLALAGMSA